MTRLILSHSELLLRNLEQRISPHILRLYMTKESVYQMLKEATGEDFGYDSKVWREWFKGKDEKVVFKKFDEESWQREIKKIEKEPFEYFKGLTEQDFGYDIEAWRNWCNGKIFESMFENLFVEKMQRYLEAMNDKKSDENNIDNLE